MEPLYEIVKYYRTNNKYNLAVLFGEMGLKMKFPESDSLFVIVGIYDYLLLFELSICYYYANEYKKGLNLSEILIHKYNIPNDIKDTVKKNFFNKTNKTSNNNVGGIERHFSVSQISNEHV